MVLFAGAISGIACCYINLLPFQYQTKPGTDTYQKIFVLRLHRESSDCLDGMKKD